MTMKSSKKKKSKLVPTLAESFEVGKREGIKEALRDVSELLDNGLSSEGLKAYTRSRISILNSLKFENPFK